jgi:hypothetical protein
MRTAFLVLAGLGTALAACSSADQNQVSTSPPTVSYRIPGTDISQANVSATAYCQRYGAGPEYQGLQATPTGNVATYTCDGPPVATSGSSVPPPEPGPLPYGAPPPTQPCADALHENLPGGTDYTGPPVPGCPSSY